MSHKLNILVAYPYMKKDVIDRITNLPDVRFVLDSGAFTAWKAGKPIKLDDYCRFIENLPFKPWRYFMLDVVGDPDATLKNYKIMLDRGFNPVPIFTRGEDISVLDEYYKTSDVVGIGGLVKTKKNKGFVKGIMEKVGNRKVHWLGFTSLDFVKHYKPYMCDSSSWAATVMFGTMNLYVGKGVFKKISKQDVIKKPSQEMFKLFDMYGEDIRRLQYTDQWRNSGRGDKVLEMIMVKSYSLFQWDIYKNFNTKYFLASATGWQIKLLYQGYLYWKNKGMIK